MLAQAGAPSSVAGRQGRGGVRAPPGQARGHRNPLLDLDGHARRITAARPEGVDESGDSLDGEVTAIQRNGAVTLAGDDHAVTFGRGDRHFVEQRNGMKDGYHDLVTVLHAVSLSRSAGVTVTSSNSETA